MQLLEGQLYPEPAIYIYPLATEGWDSFPLISSCQKMIFLVWANFLVDPMNGRVLQKENCSPLPSLAVETKCLCFRRLMRSENNSIRYLPLIKLKAWNSFHIHIFNFFLFPSPPHPPGKLLLEERRKSRPFYPHPLMIRFRMSCCVPFVEIR